MKTSVKTFSNFGDSFGNMSSPTFRKVNTSSNAFNESDKSRLKTAVFLRILKSPDFDYSQVLLL